MKTRTIFYLLSSFLCGLVLLGCSSVPYAWESRFYDIQTNITPVVIYQTNTVSRTNLIERTVTTTNFVEATGAIQITMTPTREITVVSEPVVTIKTNLLVDYIYTANTNAGTISAVGGAIAAPFGLGGIVSTGLAGLFGIWGAVRSRRMGKVAAGLVQGIEVASEVLKTTPQGQEADNKLKAWLQTHQVETGTIQNVLTLLNTAVDNAEARDVAAKIQAEIAARSKPN